MNGTVNIKEVAPRYVAQAKRRNAIIFDQVRVTKSFIDLLYENLVCFQFVLHFQV